MQKLERKNYDPTILSKKKRKKYDLTRTIRSDQIRFGQLSGEEEHNRNEDQRSHLAGATGKIKGEYEENNKCVFVCEKEVDG